MNSLRAPWPVVALAVAEAVGVVVYAIAAWHAPEQPETEEELAMFGRSLTCTGLAQPCGELVAENLQAVGLCVDCWQQLRDTCRVMSYRVASGQYTDYPRMRQNEGVVRQEAATADGYVPRRPDDVLQHAYVLRYLTEEEYHSWRCTRTRDDV